MIGLLALFWLGLIVLTFSWLCYELYSLSRLPKNIAKWGRLLSAIGVLIFITWPMLGQSIKDELSCRSVDLEISQPIDASKEGLFWRSVVPDEHGYSLGFVFKQGYYGHVMMANVRRALLEGRFAYLEFPASTKDYQRIFLAKAKGLEDGNTRCFQTLQGEYLNSKVNLPEICIAYERVSNISSKYELVTGGYDKDNLNDVKIIDRSKSTSNVIAKYAPMFRASSGMIPALATPSCTAEKSDILPLFGLISMQFLDASGNVYSRKELVKFADLKWSSVDIANIKPYR